MRPAPGEKTSMGGVGEMEPAGERGQNKKPVGVLRFPGTNCDRDIWKALELVGQRPEWIWHGDSFHPEDYGAYILPGGFSYGDYLRSGAMAALSPVMESLKKADQQGKPILGICNGFQILCEAGMLPGTLMKNQGGRFLDQWVNLKLQDPSAWGPQEMGSCHLMPMAHGEGRFFADEKTYGELLKSASGLVDL